MWVTKIFILSIVMACLSWDNSNAAALPEEEPKDTTNPQVEPKDTTNPQVEPKDAEIPRVEPTDAELSRVEPKDTELPRGISAARFADPVEELQKADIKDAAESAVADDIQPQVRGLMDALKYAGCHILGKIADPFPNPCDG